jgi:hypothetical protein
MLKLLFNVRLDGWKVTQGGDHIIVTFDKIENVGKGPAFHITVGFDQEERSRGGIMFSGKSFSFLKVGDAKQAEGHGVYRWRDSDNYVSLNNIIKISYQKL